MAATPSEEEARGGTVAWMKMKKRRTGARNEMLELRHSVRFWKQRGGILSALCWPLAGDLRALLHVRDLCLTVQIDLIGCPSKTHLRLLGPRREERGSETGGARNRTDSLARRQESRVRRRSSVGGKYARGRVMCGLFG